MKAEEIADRALINLLVLDDTAKAIHTGSKLYGDCITIGIREADNTSSFKTALQYAVGETHPERLEKTDYGYSTNIKVQVKNTEQKDIPLKIKVIKNRYEFLQPKVLNAKLYGYVYYFLPNPFTDYWLVKDEVC